MSESIYPKSIVRTMVLYGVNAITVIIKCVLLCNRLARPVEGACFHRFFLMALGLLGTILFPSVAMSETSTISKGSCESLQNLDVEGTQIQVAEAIPAGAFKAPNGETYQVPAFCRVRGLADTSDSSNIAFETWLPEHWNGRYIQWDGGGIRDHIGYAGLAWRLNKGEAVTEVDTLGAWKPDKNLQDKNAYLREPEKVLDTVRGHQVAAKRARAITTTYYQQAPHHAYFAGCSGGGYSALIQAQRNPDSWDGIIAGSPANYILRILLGRYNIAELWKNKAGRIPSERLPAIQQAALLSCSTEAYVVDGIAADPRHCKYDPAILTCQGEETNACLTNAQIDTLKGIYQGAHYRDGAPIYPGFPPTLETARNLWNLNGPNEPYWVDYAVGGGLGGEDKPPLPYRSFKSVYQNLILQGAPWSIDSYDVDRDYPRALTKEITGQHLASLMEADNPDLSAFQNNGGKLLMYYGWADSQPPEGGIQYVEQLAQRLGGQQKVQSFMQFYMVPGMTHCVGGPGANAFGQYAFGGDGKHYYARPLQDDAEHDIIQALQAWVEEGKAPAKIIAAKYIDDTPEKGVAFTRPLCAYPKVRVYKGVGDKSKASSFECREGHAPVNRMTKKGSAIKLVP